MKDDELKDDIEGDINSPEEDLEDEVLVETDKKKLLDDDIESLDDLEEEEKTVLLDEDEPYDDIYDK
jgi:hypothetical protein